jgi:phosphopantetheinyl transferase (holo-ACP synthase)
MAIYVEKILDLATDKETTRNYTADEIAKVEAAQAKGAEIAAQLEAKEAARQAVLKKLGLTADEAAALLG